MYRSPTIRGSNKSQGKFLRFYVSGGPDGPPEMAKMTKMPKWHFYMRKIRKMAKIAKKYPKLAFLASRLCRMGFGSKCGLLSKYFFGFLDFLARKKPFLVIFGPHAACMRNGPKRGKYRIWAPKVAFFGKCCVFDLGVSNSEKWRFVHRFCRDNF